MQENWLNGVHTLTPSDVTQEVKRIGFLTVHWSWCLTTDAWLNAASASHSDTLLCWKALEMHTSHCGKKKEMPARVLAAKKHMKRAPWLVQRLPWRYEIHTRSLSAMQTHTLAHKMGLTDNTREKACCNDLGFSHSSATVLLLSHAKHIHCFLLHKIHHGGRKYGKKLKSQCKK